MIGFFKERSSFQVPLLLLLTFLLKASLVLRPNSQVVANVGGLLPKWLQQHAAGLNPQFLVFAAALVLLGSAIYANFVLANAKMIPRGTLFIALSMVIFCALFPASNQMSAAVLVLPLLILLFQQITLLYNLQKPKTVIINIGLIAGAGYLLYHPFIWYLPCCFFGLAGLRAFKPSEWLLMLVSLLTPLYFELCYDFLTDRWHPAIHLPNWHAFQQWQPIHPVATAAAIVALVWLMAGLVSWQKQTRRMLIQSRKNWYQLLGIGLFSLPATLVPSGNLYPTLTLLAFSVGAFSANAFSQKESSRPAALLFWLLIITCTVAIWGWNTGRLI